MAGIPIAVAYGDGIGPEIMEATLHVLSEAGANLKYHVVEIGEKVYNRGIPTGIEPATWETLAHTEAFLKAPITTPQGGGFKSLNVTIRTTLGLYANIRPCVSYAPFVKTKHPKMDLVIVRENEEDLYAGIEYRLTPNVCESIKLISRAGSEKIVRYAFEYARQHKRKKVTCFTKDNIMKFTDGLFHTVFDEISKEYSEIENEHWIVDIGAAKMADTPEAFDVIVMPNLYGDILSDVAAQISGSVGLAGAANIGVKGAMFEAIHGSAPRRAGQNLANPSALLLGAVLMLDYLGEIEVAERIHNAWLATIEEGIHTYDIFQEGKSKQKVGTKEFGRAVAKNLGRKPRDLKAAKYSQTKKLETLAQPHPVKVDRKLVGVDVTIHATMHPNEFRRTLQALPLSHLSLKMITNRGARIWPDGHPDTFCIDEWRCRFLHREENKPTTLKEINALMGELILGGCDIVKTENLYLYDGKPGFSSASG
jgi:isocitrate dehydrogenase